MIWPPLTKPLATGLLALELDTKGVIPWQSRLAEMWGDAVPRDKKDITVRQLLTHTSGYPAHRPYFTLLDRTPAAQRKSLLKAMLMNEPLENEPGAGALYSDLGYMLLGLIIEQRLGSSLDQAVASLYESLGVEAPRYLPLDEKPPWPLERIAPCGSLPGRPLIHGQVEDENAHALGGVAGHAGLFGSARQVAALMDRVSRARREDRPWSDEAVKRLCEPDHEVAGSSRTPGFDTPQGPDSAAGSNAPAGLVGHLGFTGASVWWQVPQGRGVVLLTNRVAYGRDNLKIRAFRKEIHELSWKELAGA